MIIFLNYIEVYDQIFKYRELIFKQTTYIYGGLRMKKLNLIRRLYTLKDLVFKKFVLSARFFSRKIFIKFIYFSFKVLVRQIIKNKAVMPHRVIDEVYEIFDNVNKKKIFKKKIIVPYEEITTLYRINIYRAYEIWR